MMYVCVNMWIMTYKTCIDVPCEMRALKLVLLKNNQGLFKLIVL